MLWASSLRGNVGDDSLTCEDSKWEGRDEGGSLSGEDDSGAANDCCWASEIGTGVGVVPDVEVVVASRDLVFGLLV